LLDLAILRRQYPSQGSIVAISTYAIATQTVTKLSRKLESYKQVSFPRGRFWAARRYRSSPHHKGGACHLNKGLINKSLINESLDQQRFGSTKATRWSSCLLLAIFVAAINVWLRYALDTR
jgi:hypothetical protein